MNVIMIGAGNVATHIALRLKEKGHTPIQIWSRTEESAKTLAEQTGSRPVTSIDDIRTDADIYIISVKDDATWRETNKRHSDTYCGINGDGRTGRKLQALRRALSYADILKG